jgi:sulfate-transporting ATPase
LGGTSFWRLITYSREPILDVAQPSEGPARARLTIEAVDVSVRFGGQLALDHVTLTVAPGEVVGVIGPNGAGKSTLIDVLSGFHRVYSGSVLANGKAIDSSGPSKRARSGVIRSFQNLELFEDMSIFDNIRIAEPCSPWRYGMDLFLPKQMPMSSMTVEVLREFGLDEDAEKLPSEVDYAKRRLVSIARAIGSGPGVLLLDEPAAGLDRTAREELATVIRWISERLKVGVLLIEHDVDLVFRLCDRVVALDSGRIIAQGSPAHVRADPSVVQAYLGATSVEVRVPANAFGQPDRPAESE